jgi:ubiquinone/menaquinone biosynthesis C-methylase UbiE
MATWRQNQAFDKKFGSTKPPSYPNEMLVKLCSSKRYSKLLNRLFSKRKIKVCEIGCLSGNNIRFFLDKGWEPYGVEINDDLIKLCEKNLSNFKINFKRLKLGNNENIPYDKNFFDLLISINTIHYSYLKGIDEAINEFNRVLNKGGIAIIETPSEKHDALINSIKKEENYWVWKWGGFRQNSFLGFFDNKKKFYQKLKSKFSKVEIYDRSEVYKDIKLHWHVAVCVK